MEPFTKRLPRAIQLAHLIIRSRLLPGESAVDATVGNGHDTLFLAEIVGPKGNVYGFDVQLRAIEVTREKAAKYPQVKLFHAGHENVGIHVGGPLKAAMFNLGYLPSGDKNIVTKASTTCLALDQLSARLSPNGVITIVLYTGHEGGSEEATEVQEWCKRLDQSIFTAVEYGFMNQKNSPPSLIAIEKV